MDMLIPIMQAIFFWINLDKWQYFTRSAIENFSQPRPRIYRPEKSTWCDFQWKNLSRCCGTHVDSNRLKFHPCSINVWGSTSCLESIPAILGWTAGYCTRLSWDPVCHLVYAGLLCKYVRMLHIPRIQASNPCVFIESNLLYLTKHEQCAWHLLGMLRV